MALIGGSPRRDRCTARRSRSREPRRPARGARAGDSGGSVETAALQWIGFDLGAASIVAMGVALRARAAAGARVVGGGDARGAGGGDRRAAGGDGAPCRRSGPCWSRPWGCSCTGGSACSPAWWRWRRAGRRKAATAAGLTDAAGYVGGVLAGQTLGRLVEAGGYALGFGALAAVSGVGAVLALGLGRRG
jgi:hypothetical protein